MEAAWGVKVVQTLLERLEQRDGPLLARLEDIARRSEVRAELELSWALPELERDVADLAARIVDRMTT